MPCWRCKAASNGSVPYGDFSFGAKWRKRRGPGTFLQAKRLARATVSPLFACPCFAAGMVCIGIMLCVDLVVTQEVFWQHLE